MIVIKLTDEQAKEFGVTTVSGVMEKLKAAVTPPLSAEKSAEDMTEATTPAPIVDAGVAIVEQTPVESVAGTQEVKPPEAPVAESTTPDAKPETVVEQTEVSGTQTLAAEEPAKPAVSAIELAANVAVDPIPAASDESSKAASDDIVTRWKSIKDPVAKTKYWNEHKTELMKALFVVR